MAEENTERSTTQRAAIVRPGFFGGIVAADTMRGVFDYHNETILSHHREVDLVFIGDSITQMWDLSTFFEGGKVVVNRGIGGDVSTYALKRFDADVVQLHPKSVVIAIGINNTWVMDEPVWWRGASLEGLRRQIVSDIREMVQIALKAGIRPVVCSILPTSRTLNVNTPRRNDLVIEINHDLAEMITTAGGIYIDYHSSMVESDGKTLRSELSDDGLHPHVIGYDIMADVLRAELRRHTIEI